MTVAFALHLHGECRLVCVRCFCWEICRMAAIEWRLDGGSDVVIRVGAVIMKWRFGSVKEKTRRFGEEAFGRNERSSEEKIRKAVLERRRRDFWEHSKEWGSSVEGSLAMLVIFCCIWRIVELLLQKNWGARQRRSKKPRNFQTSFFCEFAGGNACTFGDVYILWIRYKSFFFFESHQCGSIGHEMCVVSLLCCCVCQSLNRWGLERSARHGRVLEMLRCQ